MTETITPNSSEEIVSGFVLEWYAGNRIVAYTLTSVSQATINAFIETAQGIERNRPADQKRLVLYDFSHKDVSLTPYLRQRIEEITPQGQSGRTSYILTKDVLSHSMRLFVMRDLQGGKEPATDIFFSRDVGLQWLMEALPD